MQKKPDPKELADRIRGWFSRGVDLGPAVVDFIDSTFLNPSTDELERIIRDEAAAEADCLLELLFCPDEPLQEALEEAIGEAAWEPVDETRAVELLCDPPLSAVFRFPGYRGTLRLAGTPALAERLVAQLNLGRSLPPALARAVDAAAAGGDRIRLRVRLRNARVKWSESTLAFMAALLGQEGSAACREKAFADFVLDFLADSHAGADIAEGLASRRGLLAKTIHLARRQRELLAESNVETLVSRGIRIACFDEEGARRQIAFIGRIEAAVYGRTGGPTRPVCDEAPVALEASDALELMRALIERSAD